MKKILSFAVIACVLSFNALAGGDIEAGKATVAKYSCAACHGADFNSPIDPSYPKLAGQHEDYLVQVLKEYQRGSDGPNGRGNAIMGSQAKPLAKEEVRNIAAYLHSLPGSLVQRK